LISFPFKRNTRKLSSDDKNRKKKTKDHRLNNENSKKSLKMKRILSLWFCRQGRTGNKIRLQATKFSKHHHHHHS